MRIAIVTNGDIKDTDQLKRVLEGAAKIICADGAARHLRKLGIIPHILLGDFDSIDPEVLDWMKQQGASLFKFPERKDATDTELALDFALQEKPEEIVIIGGIGSRWDHSLGNIFLLKRLLDNRVRGYIVNELNEITIMDTSLELEGKAGDVVSIVPISEEVKGISLYGFEYPLLNRDIAMGSSLGISNRLIQEKAKITVREGMLLVIKSKE